MDRDSPGLLKWWWFIDTKKPPCSTLSSSFNSSRSFFIFSKSHLDSLWFSSSFCLSGCESAEAATDPSTVESRSHTPLFVRHFGRRARTWAADLFHHRGHFNTFSPTRRRKKNILSFCFFSTSPGPFFRPRDRSKKNHEKEIDNRCASFRASRSTDT